MLRTSITVRFWMHMPTGQDLSFDAWRRATFSRWFLFATDTASAPDTTNGTIIPRLLYDSLGMSSTYSP